MSETEVSVIIPARNAAGTIGEQLEALSAQRTPRTWELIVADNGSDDETVAVVEWFRSRIPTLSIVPAAEARGPAYARNAAARHAKGELLLFCDADDIVTAGWIDALATGLVEFDAVGGSLNQESLNPPHTRALRAQLAPGYLPEVLGFERAVSSNCAVRHAVFDALGGFDPTYPASVDTEFFIRLQVEGFRLGHVPEAVVMYRHGDDLGQTLRKIYRWNVVRPRLYRQYRHAGATRDLPRGLGKWPWMAVRSYYLVMNQHRRMEWLSVAARSLGRLVGSIRYRTFFP